MKSKKKKANPQSNPLEAAPRLPKGPLKPWPYLLYLAFRINKTLWLLIGGALAYRYLVIAQQTPGFNKSLFLKGTVFPCMFAFLATYLVASIGSPVFYGKQIMNRYSHLWNAKSPRIPPAAEFYLTMATDIGWVRKVGCIFALTYPIFIGSGGFLMATLALALYNV